MDVEPEDDINVALLAGGRLAYAIYDKSTEGHTVMRCS